MALDKITKSNFAMHPPNFKVYSYWYNLLVDAINNASTTLEQVTTGITAYASGGQGSATQLTTYYNNITTCATAGDSVLLPSAAVSTVCIVKNNGVASCNVFPYSGDCINALAANLAVAVPVGAEVKFVAIDSKTWYTNSVALVLSSPTTQTGELIIQAAASAGETATIITNASQSGARTYTIPDAGASASFVMSAGAQNVAGIKTFTDATESTTSGTGGVLLSGGLGVAKNINSGEAIAATTTITAGTNITSTSGNIAASSGSVSASTTVTAGTVVVAGTGAVGTPSYTFTGRTTQGIYSVGATSVGVSSGAAGLVLTADASGIQTATVRAATPLFTPAVGTVTAVEYSTGRDMTTVLTLTNFIVGSGFTAAALAVGNALGAFPAGNHIEVAYYASISLTVAGTVVTTDSGLGSGVASGANATLSTSTWKDRLTPLACATAAGGGTAVEALKTATNGVLTGIALNATGSVKNIFLNSAGTWNANNTGNLTATGTVTLKWTKMGA